MYRGLRTNKRPAFGLNSPERKANITLIIGLAFCAAIWAMVIYMVCKS